MGDVHGDIPGRGGGGGNVLQQEGGEAIDFLGPVMFSTDKRKVEASAVNGPRTRGVVAKVEKGTSFFQIFVRANPRCSSVKAQTFGKAGG